MTAFAGSAAPGEDEVPFVGGIAFEGNRTLPDGELKDLMRTREPRWIQIADRPRYVRDWLRSDLATLEAHYHRAGFYEVKVVSLGEEDIVYDPETHSVRIRIRIEEGKRRYLRELRILPPPGEREDVLLRALSLIPGEPYDPQAPGVDQLRILRLLQEEGRFSARVGYKTRIIPTPAHAAGDSVDLDYLVERGPSAVLGELRLSGNTLPERLILREMTVNPGEALRLEEILDSKQNLLDTGYFRSVDYVLAPLGQETGAESEQIRLTWFFRERKMRTLETGVGVGTLDGLRLLGGWSHRNVAGSGQRIALNAKLSFKEEGGQRFGLNYERESIDYRFLHIVKLRAYFGLTLFREKDYEQQTGFTSLETRAIRLSAARRVDPFTVMKLREEFDFLYQDILNDALGDAQPRTVTRSLTAVLDRDTRNHYFSPTRGGQSLLSYEIAGGIQGGDHHFHRLQLSSSGHRRAAGGILAARLFLGGVWAYGRSASMQRAGIPDDGVPYEERFYCGGGSTVRGYDDNSLGPRLEPEDFGQNENVPGTDLPVYIKGGRYMIVGNLEWRFPMPLFGRDSFGGVVFLDGGGTWLEPGDLSGNRTFPWQRGEEGDTRRVFYGLGLGFRYLTPLTVIRVDFGIPLQMIAETGGRWHISLGHTF